MTDMKTTYVEFQLRPDDDTYFRFIDWDNESDNNSFEMTDEEIAEAKLAYDTFDTWGDFVNYLITIIPQDRQYLSPYWGSDYIYVDSVDEIFENN
jgi:hypothetical protein